MFISLRGVFLLFWGCGIPTLLASNEATYTYTLGWGIFTVAEAQLSVIDTNWEGEPASQVTLITRTNAFADAFYKVRNRTDSWMKADFSQTLHYTNQQEEGKRQRNVVVDFDWAEETATYRDLLSDAIREPIDITEGTVDPLGITIHVQKLPLEVGRVYQVPTTNGKESFITVVRVIDKVTRKFRSGRQEAWVVEPDIKDLGGIFKKSPNGSIRFYFSADERQVPLRMESSVAVGSFWAELDGE